MSKRRELKGNIPLDYVISFGKKMAEKACRMALKENKEISFQRCIFNHLGFDGYNCSVYFDTSPAMNGISVMCIFEFKGCSELKKVEFVDEVGTESKTFPVSFIKGKAFLVEE